MVVKKKDLNAHSFPYKYVNIIGHFVKFLCLVYHINLCFKSVTPFSPKGFPIDE